MKLLDLGGFNGDSALHFIAFPEIDQIEVYEPSPRYKELWGAISKHYPGIRFINKAVSTVNGTIDYTLRPAHAPLGSTTAKDKRDWGQGVIMTVECVDVAEIITGECWVKLDVEGSEFDILERLIETGKIKHVKRLYIEWHTSKMTKDYQPRYEKINAELHRLNIELRNW